MADLLIVGGGPAGMTAAIYGCRAGLNCLVLEGNTPGGQMVNTPEIENYPAFPKAEGWQLAQEMYRQAEKLGAVFRFEKVLSASLAGKEKKLVTAKGEYRADAVILANGVKRRKLGCPGEDRLSGKGVSYCAYCDGAFFKGRDTAVIGGGNTALEDALYLSGLCREVFLIHRREEFRGEERLLDQVKQRENIRLLSSCQVKEIAGEEKVERLVLEQKDGKERQLLVQAVFIAIGLEPDNGAFREELLLDENGYIAADESCQTNLPGVFAAGDTRKKSLRQIVTAVSDGAAAAVAAKQYLDGLR